MPVLASAVGTRRFDCVPIDFVADASAILSSLGVNPQHTIMAPTRMWAAQLIA